MKTIMKIITVRDDDGGTGRTDRGRGGRRQDRRWTDGGRTEEEEKEEEVDDDWTDDGRTDGRTGDNY